MDLNKLTDQILEQLREAHKSRKGTIALIAWATWISFYTLYSYIHWKRTPNIRKLIKVKEYLDKLKKETFIK